jgi:EXS family
MRSSWLFYVIFPGQRQHSAGTSFFIALAEVFRRFMWNFFRMENEHMTNVGHFLAARDVPLPFSMPSLVGGQPHIEAQSPTQGKLATRTMGTMKRGMVRMTSALHARHAEDFGRRMGPEKGPQKGKLPDETDISSEDNEPLGPQRTEAVGETRNVEMRHMEES